MNFLARIPVQVRIGQRAVLAQNIPKRVVFIVRINELVRVDQRGDVAIAISMVKSGSVAIRPPMPPALFNPPPRSFQRV